MTELMVAGGHRREVMEKEPPRGGKRRMGLYRMIAEFFIGFMCALAATGIYALVEKFI